MPVDDHPVHPKTVIGENHVAGCHSKRSPESARRNWYAVTVKEVGFLGQYTGKWIQDVVMDSMSRGCRQILELPECVGCQQPKDEEYIAKWKNEKSS